jgi:hypothetical protein
MCIRIILLVASALLLSVPSASAELISLKAQGSDEYTLYVSQANRDAATLDAKRKVLEKYISGVKSQNEANRLLSAKGELFKNIDSYVKGVAEIASEDKNGRIYVTIQASIDRSSLNKFLGDTFKSDSKKAGQKRKKVAFIFVAREVDTVERVKDHQVDQSVDLGREQMNESRESKGKGESSKKVSSRGHDEGERAYRGNDRQSGSMSGNMEISSSFSGRESLMSSEKAGETANSSVLGSVDLKERFLKSDAVDGRTEESAASGQANLAGTRTDSQNIENESMRSGSFDGKQSGNVAGKSEYGRDSREFESKRYDTASDQNSGWSDKESKASESFRESDSRKHAERKSTEILHSEKKNFRVSEYGTVNAQLTELFKEQGMRVSESLDGSEIMGQLANSDSINQIRPGDIRRTVAAAKNEGIDFLLIGTLDVGLERKDSATGNTLREVLLNANVYDLQGKGLEKAAAVGNLNFSGLGGTPDIAKNNALSTAVREAAVKLIAQTREYILESAEEE